LTRDIIILEGQVLVFISPRNKVAQTYPRALGSLSVAASYDSQGYGEGILTRLHVGHNSQLKFKFKLYLGTNSALALGQKKTLTESLSVLLCFSFVFLAGNVFIGLSLATAF
jgi:hypothetical protein